MKLRPLALSLVPLAIIAAACSGKSETKGEVMVSIQTDLSLPKDIDSVGLEVSVNGVIEFAGEFPAGAGALTVPATFGVVQGSNPTEAVQIRVLGRKAGKLVLLRDTVTTVPTGRLALLRMPLEWLCEGQAVDGPNTGDPTTQDQQATSTCPEGKTCVEGTCQTAAVDSSTLPPYQPANVFGGAAVAGSAGQCLDTVACFAAGYVAAVDASTCTIAKPASGTGINVALSQGPNGAGICGPEACLIPLDDASGDGWTDQGNGRLALPSAVCAQLTAGTIDEVLVTTACATKTPSVPTCGPWSSTTSAPGDFDAGAPDGATVPSPIANAFTATVTGSAGGVSITPVDGIATLGTLPLTSGSAQGILVILSDTKGVCSFEAATSAVAVPSSTTLAALITAPGSAPILPGTYPFSSSKGGTSDAGSTTTGDGFFEHFDSACGETPTEVPTGGSFTVATITPTEVTGSFSLTYADGVVNAQFAVPICAGANIANIVGGPATPVDGGAAPVACYGGSSSSSGDAGAGDQASQSVGSAGGVVETPGGVGVTIPAGALSSSVTITVQAETAGATIPNVLMVGSPYRFGPEGQTFSSPVTVVMPFTPSIIPSGETSADVVIYTAPVGTQNYTALPTTLVDATHVQATTTHFSDFVPVIPPLDGGAVSDAGALCGPGNCATGCCNGSVCMPGNSVATCGTGGNACAPCSGTCTTGVCSAACVPRTSCTALGLNCGPIGDGCGGMLNCGTCTPPAICGGGGTPSVCGGTIGPDGGLPTCTPLNCSQQGIGCGPAGDGCGNTLSCGSCTGTQTCGGGGLLGVCGG